MENLKENFWNEMSEKYPKATKEFCDWIDEWKARNKWDGFYIAADDYSNTSDLNSVKFHDYPYYVQLGIWFEFLKQTVLREFITHYKVDVFNINLRAEIEWYLNTRESRLKSGVDKSE